MNCYSPLMVCAAPIPQRRPSSTLEKTGAVASFLCQEGCPGTTDLKFSASSSSLEAQITPCPQSSPSLTPWRLSLGFPEGWVGGKWHKVTPYIQIQPIFSTCENFKTIWTLIVRICFSTDPTPRAESRLGITLYIIQKSPKNMYIDINVIHPRTYTSIHPSHNECDFQ